MVVSGVPQWTADGTNPAVSAADQGGGILRVVFTDPLLNDGGTLVIAADDPSLTNSEGGHPCPYDDVYPAVAFSPPAIAGLLIWCSADVGAFQNSDGTTPATAPDDPVGFLLDQTLSGHDLIQATAGARPTFQPGVLNGLPIVRFDAVNDFLRAAFTLNLPYTCLIVAAYTNGPANAESLIEGVAAVDNTMCIKWIATGPPTLGIGAGGSVIDSVYPTSLEAFVLRAFIAQAGAGNSSTYLNGIPLLTGTCGATNPAGATVGASWNDLKNANVDVAELVIYDHALSAPDLASITDYLMTKWDL